MSQKLQKNIDIITREILQNLQPPSNAVITLCSSGSTGPHKPVYFCRQGWQHAVARVAIGFLRIGITGQDTVLNMFSQGPFISGKVSDILENVVVSLSVFSPQGLTVAIAQPHVSYSGSYSTELTAGGIMQDEGTYTIKVLYGTAATSAETKFHFETSSQSPKDCGPNQIYQNGQCLDIDESSLTVSTDQSYYYEVGDLVKITGKIVGIEGVAVSLQIINPDDNVIHSEQLSPRSDDSFSTSFVMGDPSFEFGKYVVKVEFGSVGAETSFWYNPN